MDTVYNVTRVYLEMPHSYGGGEHGEDGEEDTGDGQGPGGVYTVYRYIQV